MESCGACESTTPAQSYDVPIDDKTEQNKPPLLDLMEGIRHLLKHPCPLHDIQTNTAVLHARESVVNLMCVCVCVCNAVVIA